MWTEADGKVLRAKARRGDANAPSGLVLRTNKPGLEKPAFKGVAWLRTAGETSHPDAQERIVCQGLRRNSQTLAAPAKLGTILGCSI